jgi:protein-S-isoprenylcysteine O-methyltransferase Ste14
MPRRDLVASPITRAVVLARDIPLPAGHVAGVLAALVLHCLHPLRLPARSPWPRRVFGLAALAAGGGLNAWALAERRRATPGAFRLDQPQALVTTGPYAWSRHPMYVGWWLVHLGVGLLGRSDWVVVTLPMATLAEHREVIAEEQALLREFGPAYARYACRVRRYLGRRIGPVRRMQSLPGRTRRMRGAPARQAPPWEAVGM